MTCTLWSVNQAELFKIPWTSPALSKRKHLSFPLCEIRILLLLWQVFWSEYLNHAQHFYTPSLQIISEYINITKNRIFFSLIIQTFKIHEDSRGGDGGQQGESNDYRSLDLTVFQSITTGTSQFIFFFLKKKPILFWICCDEMEFAFSIHRQWSEGITVSIKDCAL